MKFTVIDIVHEPSELDDDIISFMFRLHFTEPDEMTVGYFCTMDDLLQYLEVKHPAFFDYYERTNISLDKWGPAETQTLEALGPEALDQLYEYLKEYVAQSEIPKWAYDMGLRMREVKPEEHEKQAKAMQNMAQIITDGFVNIKSTTNRHRLFCELADRKMRELALEIFPEISNLHPEDLKEFRYFFVDEIEGLSERIDLLLSGDSY